MKITTSITPGALLDIQASLMPNPVALGIKREIEGIVYELCEYEVLGSNPRAWIAIYVHPLVIENDTKQQ